jgi:hypothetical protein
MARFFSAHHSGQILDLAGSRLTFGVIVTNVTTTSITFYAGAIANKWRCWVATCQTFNLKGSAVASSLDSDQIHKPEGSL